MGDLDEIFGNDYRLHGGTPLACGIRKPSFSAIPATVLALARHIPALKAVALLLDEIFQPQLIDSDPSLPSSPNSHFPA